MVKRKRTPPITHEISKFAVKKTLLDGKPKVENNVTKTSKKSQSASAKSLFFDENIPLGEFFRQAGYY